MFESKANKRRNYLKQFAVDSIGDNVENFQAEISYQQVRHVAGATIPINIYVCPNQRTLQTFIDLLTRNSTSTGFLVGE